MAVLPPAILNCFIGNLLWTAINAAGSAGKILYAGIQYKCSRVWRLPPLEFLSQWHVSSRCCQVRNLILIHTLSQVVVGAFEAACITLEVEHEALLEAERENARILGHR